MSTRSDDYHIIILCVYACVHLPDRHQSPYDVSRFEKYRRRGASIIIRYNTEPNLFVFRRKRTARFCVVWNNIIIIHLCGRTADESRKYTFTRRVFSILNNAKYQYSPPTRPHCAPTPPQPLLPIESTTHGVLSRNVIITIS